MRVTTKGQVTIPKEIRDRLSLHPGDVLDFRFDEQGKLTIEVSRDGPLGDLPGLLGERAPELLLRPGLVYGGDASQRRQGIDIVAWRDLGRESETALFGE